MYEEFIIFITAIVLSYIVWSNQRPKNFPPGPRGLPILGCLPFIKGDLHTHLIDLSQKYGKMFSIQMGSTPIVVLNGWKYVKEVIVNQSDTFSGRPKLFLFEEALKGKEIAASTSTTWKDQKRFTLQHLRDFGFGKTVMEEVIISEIKNTIHFLENNVDSKKVHIPVLFFAPVLSIIAKITTGETFEINDQLILKMSEAMKYVFDSLKHGSILNFLPYLTYIPGATYFEKFMSSHKIVEDIVLKETEKHMNTFKEGAPRDFTDVYLAEHLNNTKANIIFEKDYMNGVIYDLYNAGVATMESTLGFTLLYLATWPEIQQKAQKEIDEVIGHGRFPAYSDRKLLQYCIATTMEVHRYASIVPFGPQAPIEDAKLMGYSIPKGTFILKNIWAVHHDKDLWGDPENFRPERFLDSEGKVQTPEFYIPFSLGARYCMGASLAKMEFFMFFTCLLQRYSFHFITGKNPPSLKPIVGVILRPQPYHLSVKKRF